MEGDEYPGVVALSGWHTVSSADAPQTLEGLPGARDER